MKHTQGKWTGFDNESGDITIQSDNGELIGCIWETVSEEEMKANAKLIASAPELLYIVDQLVKKSFRKDGASKFTDYSVASSLIDKAQEAIKKATE